MSRWLLILLAFTLARPAAAEVLFEGLEPGGALDVDTAVTGDTLRLVDGRELRLAAIEMPPPELPHATGNAPRGAAELAALAETARATLTDLAGHRTVAIYYDQRRNDRYGRIVAHVAAPPERWIQAELLRRGLARVHTTPDLAAASAPLLRIEAEARTNRLGLWALAAYRVRRPDDLARWLDSFQVVEGQIAGSHRSASQTWLVFDGQSGEGQFGESRAGHAPEIAIPSASRKYFRAAGIDPVKLVGTMLRVRGWVRWQSGPLIDVDHPAQIESLK